MKHKYNKIYFFINFKKKTFCPFIYFYSVTYCNKPCTFQHLFVE